MPSALASLLIAVGLCLFAGCKAPAVTFPGDSLADAAKAAGALAAYDTGGRGRADYFLFAGADGRVTRIAYDRDGDGKPDDIVDMDAIPAGRARHLVIILDGFGFDVLRDYWDAGGLRLCAKPSRVISPYPSLTDLSLEDVLGYRPCLGYEAMYYDRRANKIAGGNDAYLHGDNEPYNRLLQYRADTLMDAIGYVWPWEVFNKELNDCKRRFDSADTQEIIAYFVSTACVSTAEGADGQRKCLRRVEQLVNQVVWESRGQVKVTVLSDHGHSYTPAERIPLEQHLASKGWRVADSLQGDKDVVYVRFGLVTYASFATRKPAELAADLVTATGVELASYADGDAAVVLSNDGGKAVIRQKGGRYKYELVAGDPLKLKDILAPLKADADGYYAAADVFKASADHTYPDPLERLWRAHFGLAQNVPDVIVSLADRYYSGQQSFGGAVKVASTHGSLNNRNSSAFIMSSIGPLPQVMRSGEVPKNLSELLGTPWPMRK